jgi:hypothetical protein
MLSLETIAKSNPEPYYPPACRSLMGQWSVKEGASPDRSKSLDTPFPTTLRLLVKAERAMNSFKLVRMGTEMILIV